MTNKRQVEEGDSKETTRIRTSLDDDEAQEEDDWNIFEDDVNDEVLPPSAEEERQAERET